LRTVTPDRLFPTLWIYLIKAVDAGTVALDSPGRVQQLKDTSGDTTAVGPSQ
jgi:hypothetical protein